nr:MAG TPA: hypothetical protein [Caudoviricetes sp.]
MALHLTGFHKTVVQRLVRGIWRTPHLPTPKQMQIVRQHRKTQPLRFPELPCQVVRYFFCWAWRCIFPGLHRDAEVRRKPPGGVTGILSGELRRQVDHVPGLSATEAVKVVGVQLHAGCTVVMERAAGHAAAIDRQVVSLCRHLRRDSPLDGFI